MSGRVREKYLGGGLGGGLILIALDGEVVRRGAALSRCGRRSSEGGRRLGGLGGLAGPAQVGVRPGGGGQGRILKFFVILVTFFV